MASSKDARGRRDAWAERRRRWQEWRGRIRTTLSRRRAATVGFFRFYGGRAADLWQALRAKPLSRGVLIAAWLAVVVGAVGLATRIGLPGRDGALWPRPVLPTRPPVPPAADSGQVPGPGVGDRAAPSEPVPGTPVQPPPGRPSVEEGPPPEGEATTGGPVAVPTGSAAPAGPGVEPLGEPVSGGIDGMIWPVSGEIVRGFGSRRDPILQQWRYVAGVTLIATDAAGEVRAAQAGSVAAVEGSPAEGFTVRLTHAGGWQTVYAGLVRARVSAGERVARGQVIGEILPARPAEDGAVLASTGSEEAADEMTLTYLPGGANPVPGPLPDEPASPAAIVAAHTPPAGSTLVFSLEQGELRLDPTIILE